MPLVGGKDTLAGPSITTNIGEQVKEQNEDRRSTAAVNKALLESGTSFDPQTQTINKTGYIQAVDEYNQWLATRGEAVSNATSISLNKDTGKITVSAPKNILDNPSVKENYDKVLKELSKAYKADPKQKFALMKDSDETKTVEDWVKDLEKSLKEEAPRIQQREEIKAEYEEKDGVKLSDEDVIKMYTVAVDYNDENGETVKVTKNTLQAIPLKLMDLNIFKNLKDYDRDKHVVKWENLSEVYNRDNVSDDDILELYQAVEDYFAKKDFSDPTEYAEMTALATFLARKDPSVNFWRGTGEVLGNAITGIISGAAQFDVDVLSAGETFGNFVSNILETVSYTPQDTEDFKNLWELSKENDSSFLRDYLAPELEGWRKERHERLSKLNDVAAGTYTITDTLTPIAMHMATTSAAGKAASAYAESIIGRAVTSIAVKYGTTASEMAALTATNIASGAITVEEITKGLYVGTEIMLTLSDAATASAAALKAISAVRSVSIAAGAITKMADIAAQTVVDVTLSNPKLFRQLMESGDKEAKAYAMEQLVQNVAGELGGVAIARGVTNFSRSDVGQILNARYATRLNGLKASVGETVDNIKINLFHGGNKSWLVEKASKLSEEAKEAQGKWYDRILSNRASKAERQLRNYAERLVSRKASQEVADIAKKIKGSTWDELKKSSKKAYNEMREVIADANVNVIQAMYAKDVSAEVAKIVADHNNLKSARGAYLDSLTTLLKAEDAAGLGKNLKKVKVGDGAKVRTLSKETNEYANALYRARIAEIEVDISDVAEDIKAAKKELDYLNPIIENFEKANPELAAAAKDLEKKARQLEASIQETRVAEKVMSEDTLAGMRSAGLFQDGYLRQQRVKDWKAYKQNGGKLTARQIKSQQRLGWGDVSEWQDMSLVVFDDMEELARQVVRKRATDTLKGLGFDVTVRISEDGSRILEEASPLVKKSRENVQKRTNQFVKSMDESFFNDFFDFKKKQTVVNIAEESATKQGGKLASASQIAPRTNRIERRAFVTDADDEVIDQLIEINQDNPFFIDIDADGGYEAFENGLGKEGKRWLREKIRGQVGYLFEEPTSEYNKAIGEIASMEKYNAQSWRKATGQHVPYWAKSFVTDTGGREISDLTEIDELKKYWETTKDLSKKKPTLYNADNFRALITNDPDALTELKRIYATHNRDIVNSPAVSDAVANIKQKKAVAEARTIYAERLQRLRALQQKYNLPAMENEIMDSINELIEQAIDVNANDPQLTKALTALGDETAGGDDLLEYVTIKSLADNSGNIKKQFRKAATKKYNEAITEQIRIKYAENAKGKRTALQKAPTRAKQYADESAELLDEVLTQRLDEITGRLAAQGSDIIDKDDYFAKVGALNKQITEAASDPNVVKTYGAHGYEEYIELSPTIASMFTNVPRPIRQGPFGVIQNAFVRTFRFGTTGGIIPGSLINQAFRDTGNAIVSGNAWKSSREVRRILTEEFGDTVAEYMQKEMPDVWDTLTKQAEETGKPVEELLARRELERGSMNVEAQLEKNIYQLGRESRAQMRASGVYERSLLQRGQDALDRAQEILEIPNSIREKALRNRVYANNLLYALEDGMSLPDARTFAQFMQQEATTNFTRQSYHLANLSQTVPYLSAAINGQKSFWRLYTLDPVGVTTRIVGGYVVPVIALTANSLKDEENRRIYEQINEYDKNENMTFVVEGQIISIPIPKEVSAFVRPVQNMVEKMYGANDKSFNELMANDLLGSFPIDLSGFVNIDADRILAGNLVSDHLLPGFMRIASSMMTPLMKSGFMMTTGIDPYTGKRISKNNYTYDPETGERLIMDYNTGALATKIGSKLGNFISAPMAQKVLENLFGKGGMTIIDGLGDIVDAVNDDDKTIGTGFSQAGQRLVESATDKLTVERYGEESNLAWQRAVNELERRKEELLNDDEYNDDLAQLERQDLSEKARKKIESRVKTKQQEYMQSVLDASNNLITQYGGTFDRKKLLTVISLMNLDKDSINDNPYNKYATYLNEEDADLNKAVAVETMMNMGFRSATDSTLFGYYYQDADGNTTIKYNSPLAILNYKYSSWQQGNLDEVIVEDTLKDKGLTLSAKTGPEFNAAKAAGKQALKAYKSEWNKKVVKALAPYIEKRGVDAFLNSARNRDLLDNYIFVDNPFKTKEYLKEIFGEGE